MITETEGSVARTWYVWARQLMHYLEVENPGTHIRYLIPIVIHLKRLLKHNGQFAAIQHLKVSLFALYSYVAGNPLSSTMPLGYGVRLQHGLPAVWHRELRERIRSETLWAIRLMASLLNLYRVMDAKHPDMNIDTIIQPHPHLEQVPLFHEFQAFCKSTFPALLARKFGRKGIPPFEYESAAGMLVRSAGPNLTGPGSAGLILDAKAWGNAPENLAKLWFDLHGDTSMSKLLDAHCNETHFNVGLPHIRVGPSGVVFPQTTMALACLSSRVPKAVTSLLQPAEVKWSEGSDSPAPILGRLHAIEEPAGKVRVVAIVDYWTQAALKPVHDFLFKILRQLRANDATFDQDGVVDAYFGKELFPHWSFDLKSATDLIPLALYKELLEPLLRMKEEEPSLGKERVSLWARLMTDRTFGLPTGDLYGVRYGTGQPMGALSSWASMALVHHCLIQFAAFKAGALGRAQNEWFPYYLVLGDDVDISCNEAVASRYQEICSAFGIVIGIAKSLQSNKNCFEFANQRFCPAGNISPISIREEAQANSWGGRVEFAKRIIKRLGSKTKDASSALLRKVMTASQWTALVPEMSGLRESSLLRIVKFCLHNPFADKANEVGIPSIMAWLALVLPKEDNDVLNQALVGLNNKEQLINAVCHNIADKLTVLLKGLSSTGHRLLRNGTSPSRCIQLTWSGHPSNWDLNTTYGLFHKPFSIEETIPRAKLGIKQYELAKEFAALQVGSEEPIEAGGLDSLRCRTAWSYLLYCCNKQNERTIEQAARLLRKVEVLKSLTWSFNGITGVYDKLDQDPDLNHIGRWVELYRDALSIPKLITIDFSQSLAMNLGYEEHQSLKDQVKGRGPTVPVEYIYGPMSAVCQAIARHTGVQIPGIPFFRVKEMGRSWLRSLNHNLFLFKQEQTYLAAHHRLTSMIALLMRERVIQAGSGYPEAEQVSDSGTGSPDNIVQPGSTPDAAAKDENPDAGQSNSIYRREGFVPHVFTEEELKIMNS